MLVEDEKKLRWCGLDMRSRERRRNAVVVSYALFLAAVWWHPPRTYETLQFLFYAGLLAPMFGALEEATSKAISRGIMWLLLIAMAVPFVLAKHPERDLGMTCAYAFAVLLIGSAVGVGKMVEVSGKGWLAAAILRGEKLKWRGQRKLARRGYAVGLDGFAWYEYGMRFKALTEEQKLEIQQMRRENPRGKWMRDRATVLFDDERMRHEDDRVRARVQRVMSFVLVASGFAWLWAYEADLAIPHGLVVEWAWTLAGMSMTLRQAMVLWMEEDPRAVTGELGVVRELEA